MPGSSHGGRRVGAAALAMLSSLALASSAAASLGASRASIEADRAHLAATRKATAAATFTVDSMTLPNGGSVKEFSRPDGTVFAVSWAGPGRPNLQQLLGPHFSTLQADTARQGPRLRRPLSVNRSDLIVQSGGHSGAFWGVALLPQSTPAGFSTNDLR